MKNGVGCIVLIIGIIILTFISREVSDVIIDWVRPYVSTQIYKWTNSYLPIVIIIIFGGIVDLIIVPFLRKRYF